MKYTTKLYILCLVIIKSVWISNAQDFESTIKFADEQFKLKNYQLAVKEYQRALFFAKGRKQDYLYKQIADAFFVNNQFEQAQYFYELSYKTTNNDSIKNNLILNEVQCFLLLKQFSQALVQLYNFPENCSEYFTNRKNFYLGITYFGLEDFNKAEHFFLQTVKERLSKTKISQVFKNKRSLYRPNPKTAKTLSMIIPGLGQIYTGDIKNSLNSLALTGSFAYLAVYLAIEYSYLDAIVTAVPWFTRYYQGGYRNAYEKALLKRQNRRNKAYIKLLNIIENEKKRNK